MINRILAPLLVALTVGVATMGPWVLGGLGQELPVEANQQQPVAQSRPPEQVTSRGQMYFGRWEWHLNLMESGSPGWGPPGVSSTNQSSALDLRPKSQSSQVGGVGGYGFFAYGQSQSNPLLLIDLGTRITNIQTSADLAEIEQALGIPASTIVNDRVGPLITELKTVHADPRGVTSSKPIVGVPGKALTIQLGSQVITSRNGTQDDFDRNATVYRENYPRLRAFVDAGDMLLDDLRRMTGYKMRELRLRQPDSLLPAVNLSDGFLPPSTIKNDDFTDDGSGDENIESHTPQGTNAGDSWTRVVGSAGETVVDSGNGWAESVSLATNNVLRMDNALSSDAHWAQVIIGSTGASNSTNFSGPILRIETGASPALDYYECRINNGADEMNLFRHDTGTPNFLGGASITESFPDTAYFEIDASGNYDCQYNAVSIVSGTDNNHTGNTHGGFEIYKETSGTTTIDDFESADMAVAGRRRVIFSDKR